MFGARRGRPSLIGAAARTSARTAVIVGTANAMSRPRGGVAPAPAAAPAPTHASGLDAESIGRLKEIAELHAAGILNDAEFADQKAKVLAG
jgi:hypothetical protein